MPSNDIVLKRDCEATTIPFGGVQLLGAGTTVRVLQSLGGSYTVANERGEMLRIEAKDADALGVETQRPTVSESAKFSEELVWSTLKTVYDPEIPADIYELGLVYSIDIADDRLVSIDMTLTAPACPVAGEMPGWVENAVAAVSGVSGVKVNMVFDPPWDQSRMSDEARVALDMW